MYSTYHLQLMTAKTLVTCQSVARSGRKLNNGDDNCCSPHNMDYKCFNQWFSN